MNVTRHHFPSIDSTNTWAKRNAQFLSQHEVTLVTADEQTAGRGRFQRHWESPANQNIYATFCFFVDHLDLSIGHVPQVLAISAAEALEELQFYPKLKWPNDVLLSGKKVGGILCETSQVANRFCVVVGIGINVNMPLEVAQKIDRPATSLLIESGLQQDINGVLALLQKHFISNLSKFQKEGFVNFLSDYKSRLAHNSGDSLHFHGNLKVWEGKFHSILPNGSLNLLLPSGEIKNFISGEILFKNLECGD